jgi:hypothetical protein
MPYSRSTTSKRNLNRPRGFSGSLLEGFLKEGGRVATCSAEALEWGVEGWQDRAASLQTEPIDYIIAADCVYVDRVCSPNHPGSGPPVFVYSQPSYSGIPTHMESVLPRQEALLNPLIREHQKEMLSRTSPSEQYHSLSEA